MTRYLTALLFALLLGIAPAAARKIAGIVLDNVTYKPVANAKIYVQGRSVATTNSTGEFVFYGNYDYITIKHSSYIDKNAPSLPSQTKLKVYLEPIKSNTSNSPDFTSAAHSIVDKKGQNTRIITGEVVNAITGEPLTAATVRVAGETIVTTTNLEGKFNIRIPNNSNVAITARYVGYKLCTVNVMLQTDLTLALVPDLSNTPTVNDYIGSQLPTFDKYCASSLKGLKLPEAAAVKAAIERDIEAWQVKGEFESTAKWQARVNEQTRRARVDSLTRVANAESARIKAEYDRKIPALKQEYESLRQKYAKEFYAVREKEKRDSFDASPLTLKPYDADNETFLITSAALGDILLPVAVDQAPGFKQQWEAISKTVKYEFAPKDERDVALTKVTFTNGGKAFVYDGSADVSYAIADVNYNFAPLEIGDLSVADLTLPEIGASPVAQTVTSPGIGGRKVEPKRNELSVGNGIPDVDANVPVGSAKRETTFALIIANENYRRVSAVPYAANDGKMMAQYMHTTLGIPEKNIHAITDATLGDMRYELEWLGNVGRAHGAEASVIVYYAGHGVPDEDTRDAYLLPTDGFAERATATGFSLGELQATLDQLPVSQATLLLDACFSGVSREGQMLTQARGVAIKPKTHAPKGNLVVLSASQGTETAHPYAEKRHGLFTYFLLKKLGETNGSATLGELADYVTSEVKKASSINGKLQTPTVLAAPGNTSWASKRL